MLAIVSYSNGLCETCLKNAHEKVQMNRSFLVSTFDSSLGKEIFVCPKCGATKE
ncbi:MAG: hypothetical protein V1944_02385 [Candidatus Aenigmatarchaeota archaeon]